MTRGGRAVALSLSVLLCLAASICVWRRPDACAAVAVWPVWVWALPGLGLVALARLCGRHRLLAAVTLLWVAYLLVFAEEPRSLLRWSRWPTQEWQAAQARGEALRVVSLNCNGGSVEAAADTARYRPDIVLLQESPSRRDVAALAKRLFGQQAGFVWGPDASILARGRVSAASLPPDVGLFLAQARVRTPSGREVEVVSTRLLPPVFRIDLYSPDCWREQVQNRQARREQVEEIARRLRRVPAGVPLIIGGDWNAPAGDAALWPLRPRLRDAFPEAGRGWGNTAINESRVLRIDQVWVSEQLAVGAVQAHVTDYSDHALVTCDLMLRGD